MAYQNFIPTVWNAAIERELERDCVFVEDCNREYEGEVKDKGDSVKILGVGSPTITTIGRDKASADINAAEEIEDTSSILYINQLSYFNYMVGDVDKAQAQGGLMDALNAETSEKLASTIDAYVAGFALDESVKKLYSGAKKVVAGSAGADEVNVLQILDEALQKLYENDVAQTTKIVATVSPRFYTLFRREYASKDTDNSGILKNGRVGMYGNVIIKMSNNVKRSQTTSAGDTDNIMIRTRRAIAFAQPKIHTEAYRPEKKFADAVKGFVLYDAKVVRPKEIININVKY